MSQHNLKGKSLKILMVVHGLPPQRLGGTETTTLRLAQALRGHHEITLLTVQISETRPEIGLKRSQLGGIPRIDLIVPPEIPKDYAQTYRNRHIEGAFASLLAHETYDLIHFQHLTGLSLNLPAQAKAASIPYIMTLHDYWLACPRGQLLAVDLSVCAGPRPKACGRCLMDQLSLGSMGAQMGRWIRHLPSPTGAKAERKMPSTPPITRPLSARKRLEDWVLDHKPITPAHQRALKKRETLAKAALENAAIITAPSTYLLDRFDKMGWLPPASHTARRVLDNILPPVKPPPPMAPPTPLRLIFIGSCIPSKGVDYLLRAMGQLLGQGVHLTLVGPMPNYHRRLGYADELRALMGENITHLGPKAPEAALALLATHHALVLPSIWEENAPVTLREALLMGKPVIASQIGGIPEVVKGGQNGLLVPPRSVEALVEAIIKLKDAALWESLHHFTLGDGKRHLGAQPDDWKRLYDSTS